MNIAVIIVFLVVGALLLTLELIALPGGIAGIVGVIMMVIGIWQSYIQYGVSTGNICLIISLAIILALLIIFMRNKTWRKAGLKEEISSKVNTIDENQILVGSTGTTISRLAPAGKAMINGQIIEVHTLGEFVDENRKIEVVCIEGYYVTVKEVK